MHLGMVIEPHYCLVAYLGGPRLYHIGMQNLIAQGPKVLLVMLEVTWGN